MRVLPLLCLVAAQASADMVAGPVTADLNADGTPERFTLDHSGDGGADLVIEATGGGVIIVDDIAWIGGEGQEPSLALTDAGELQIISMNEAAGPSRWRLVLTVDWRDGDYHVIGYTYDDQPVPGGAPGGCDLNLATGQGVAYRGDETRVIAAPFPVTPLAQWSMNIQVPEICRPD